MLEHVRTAVSITPVPPPADQAVEPADVAQLMAKVETLVNETRSASSMHGQAAIDVTDDLAMALKVEAAVAAAVMGKSTEVGAEVADQMAAETAGEVEYTMPLAAVSFADVEVAAAGAEGAQPIKKATRSEASRRTDRSKRSSKSRRHREKHNGSWLQNTVLSPLLRAAKRYEKPLHELSAELKLAGENMRDTIGTQILRGLACSPRDSWAGLNGTPQTAAHPSHRSLLSPSKDTNSPSNFFGSLWLVC